MNREAINISSNSIVIHDLNQCENKIFKLTNHKKSKKAKNPLKQV